MPENILGFKLDDGRRSESGDHVSNFLFVVDNSQIRIGCRIVMWLDIEP
jgi:hypothetical protein